MFNYGEKIEKTNTPKETFNTNRSRCFPYYKRAWQRNQELILFKMINIFEYFLQ